MKKLLMTILLGLALIIPSVTFAKSDTEVLRWVEVQMEAEESYPTPKIYRLPKRELKILYCALDSNCESVETFKSEVMAFYSPRIKTIFITDFEDECWEEAVLSHELAHYVQDKIYGLAGNTEIGRAYMEMQAYTMMDIYKIKFCE